MFKVEWNTHLSDLEISLFALSEDGYFIEKLF